MTVDARRDPRQIEAGCIRIEPFDRARPGLIDLTLGTSRDRAGPDPIRED
jgi:hypothetical protein